MSVLGRITVTLIRGREELLVELALMEKGVAVVTRIEVNLSDGTIKRAADLVRERLQTLSAQDRRATKRKFRKLVRRTKKSLRSSKHFSQCGVKWRIEKMDGFVTREDGSSRLTKAAIEARNLEVQLHFKRMQIEGKL